MELGFEFWYTAALLIVMTVLLVTERFEIEVVMFSVLLLLVLGDVITLQDAFSGFSNVGMLTIAMLFVIAGALNNTGVLRKVSDVIFGEKNNGVGRKLIRILFPVSAISAFMNNTPVVAMLIPIIRSWTERQQQFPSKYLIPISYAAILGGTCTLIGTSTNLIVHGLMLQHGLQGIGLFEITKIGVPATIVGLLFIVLIGHRLLPSRREPLVELGESTREFVIELKVTNDYENINKTIEASGLRHLKGLYLFQIERNGDTIAPARPDEKILEGDRLFFTGIPKTILELQKTPGLHLTKDSHFDLKDYDSSQIKTFECVVSDASPLVGKNIRESNFREKYQAVILAIHRHGQRIRKKIGDISINPGDTLLLLADKNFLRRWYHSKDFYLISKGENLPSKPQWQGNFSVAALIIIILLTVFNILPLLAAAGLGVLALVLSKIVSRSEILSIIDWRVLVIISLSLGIATGVEKSGVAEVLASVIVNLGNGSNILWGLAGVYIMTSLYNAIITSNATAALLFPIALSTATALQADAHAFAIAVMIAAAASFATPISYQTNLMVYSPGGYKFKDFLKIGIPLQILIGIVALPLIYYFYF